MPWFPEIANPAFCETLHLRRIILDRQKPPIVGSTRHRVLEPGSAEFIAALAAGSNSRSILHLGCGLSTIALAAAAKATGGRLLCVESNQDKQAIVRRYAVEFGLSCFVDFLPESWATFFARQQQCFDFVLFTGEPENYIDCFDLVRFTSTGIVVAYNALDNSTNEYIKHVRHQPGIDSSTLPVGRGIEVSKILSWDAFKTGRQLYCDCAAKSEDLDVAIPHSDEVEAAVDLKPEVRDKEDASVVTCKLPTQWEQESDSTSFYDEESLYGSPLCCALGEEPKFLCSSSSSSSLEQESAVTVSASTQPQALPV